MNDTVKISDLGKVLVVCQTIHPWTSGSSVIMSNLAAEFSQDEMVLFGEEYTGNNSEEWPRHQPNIVYDNPNFSIANRGHSLFRWKNIKRTISKIIKLARQEEATKILAVYPDDYFMYAAYRASVRLDIPMYTWFHNTYLDNVSGYKKVIAKWLQPKIFAHAKVNFCMSDGMADFLRQKYQGVRFETLVHAFPLPSVRQTGRQLDEDHQAQVSFVYSGFLNESCREATIRMLKVILGRPDAVVHAFTGTSPETFSRHGVDISRMVFHPFLPMDEFYEALSLYDIMLLPHGFDGGRTQVEYDTIFPTRTIPLLVSGRPILANSPKGSFLTRFLNDNGCAIVVDSKSSAEINKAIDVVCSNPLISEKIAEKALEVSRLFQVSSVANTLKTTLCE